MKLFKRLKELKPDRKKYRVKPTIKFYVDKNDYYFSFLPTALWMPWIYRYPNSNGVVDIWWLNFHILIGRWEELSCRNCKHQDECVKSKRLEWYFDNVFEKGEKCSDFEAKY
jgi:hypothetical protein